MQATLARPSLKLVSWCHLKPVTIKIEQHVPVDPRIFPAAQEGFDDFSMASQVSYFGYKMGLVDISGLTHEEVKERVKIDFDYGHSTSAVEFLRCLEFIQSEHCTPFPFERIAAYPVGSEPVAAVRIENGFKRVPCPDPETLWEPGTLGLFNVPDL
ncbi:MAG: hypothetical protein JWN64_656 [Parcubacteria group bacterium]|nr:hypothetical protein [Parcubacteria group bacterium]